MMASLAEGSAGEHIRALGGLSPATHADMNMEALGGVSLATHADMNMEGGAFVVKEGSLAQRPLRRGPKHRYIQVLTVTIIASLTALYLVLSCFRHISQVNNVGSHHRGLAEGGSEGIPCLGDPDEEPAEGAESADEETQAEEKRAVAGAAGGTEEEASQQPTSARDTDGWGRRKMTPEWVDRVRRHLLRLKTVTLQCTELLPTLSPEFAVELAQLVAKWATVEVGSLSYIPDDLQPVRAEAGSAVVSLLEQVLAKQAFAGEVRRRRIGHYVQTLQRLLLKLNGRPPMKEKLSRSWYKGTLTSQWSMSFYALSHVKCLLELLQPQNNPGGIPPELAEQVLTVVNALFIVRRQSLLERRVWSRWFLDCQAQVAKFLLYTPADYDKAEGQSQKRLVDMLAQVATAVTEAGGLPLPLPLPLETAEQVLEGIVGEHRPVLTFQAQRIAQAQASPPQGQASPPPQALPHFPPQPQVPLFLQPQDPPPPQAQARPFLEAQVPPLPQPRAPSPPQPRAFPPPQPRAPPPPQALPHFPPQPQVPLFLQPQDPPPPQAQAPPFLEARAPHPPQAQAPPPPPLSRPRLPPQAHPRFPFRARPRPAPQLEFPPPPQLEAPPPPQPQVPLLPKPQALPHLHPQFLPPPHAQTIPSMRTRRLPRHQVPGIPVSQLQPFHPQVRVRLPRHARARPRLQYRSRFPRAAEAPFAFRPQAPPHRRVQPVPRHELPPVSSLGASYAFPREMRFRYRGPPRPRPPPQFARPPQEPFPSAPIQMPTPPFQWFPSSDPMHFQSGESGPVVFQPPDQPLTYTEEGVPPAPFPQQPGPPQPPLFVEIPQPTYPPQLLPQAYLFMPQPPPEPLHQAPTVVWVPVGPPPSSHDYITLPSDQNYPSYDPHPIPPGDVHDLHSVYQQDPQSSTFPGPRLPPHSERYPVPPQGPDPTQEPPPPPQPAATDAGGWESEGEGGGDGEVATQLSTLSLDDHQEGQ